MTFKVFLMGGIGNQLFQITRAKSIQLEGQKVILLKLGRLKKIVYYLIGHPQHEDWLNIIEISKSLNIEIRNSNFYELIQLFYFYFLKKISLFKDFDISLKDRLKSKKKLDIGYFQDTYHSHQKAQDSLIVALRKTLMIGETKTYQKKICTFHLRGGDFFYPKNNKIFKRSIDINHVIQMIQEKKDDHLSINIVTNDKFFMNELSQFSSYLNFFSSTPKDDFLILIHSHQMYVSQSSFCYWAYLLAKELYGCKVLNIDDWVYKKLI